MTTTQRLIQIGMIFAIALFFSIVSFNNIFDFNTNWHFVEHVLLMDTLKSNNITLLSRAITNSTLEISSYYFIIIWETLTAGVCWFGFFKLVKKIKSNDATYHEAKKFALIGLFMGFVLYMVGFIIIGGEWFCMWQSSQWNGQQSASNFLCFILFVMLFLK